MPYMYAIQKGDPELVKLLLHHGASANQAHGPGMLATPLYQAADTEKLYLSELLVKHGTKLDQRIFGKNTLHGVTALHRAAELGRFDIMYYLTVRGADVGLTYRDHDAELHHITSLHVARAKCVHSVGARTRKG